MSLSISAFKEIKFKYARVAYQEPLEQASDGIDQDSIYKTDDGYTIQRLWTHRDLRNVAQIGGRWALIDPTGKVIDVNKYRNDLSERFNIELRG